VHALGNKPHASARSARQGGGLSVLAPVGPISAATLAAELRAALGYVLGRLADGQGVPTCTGLDDATVAALLAHAASGDPAALAAAPGANEPG
jgi:hypothetical protein